MTEDFEIFKSLTLCLPEVLVWLFKEHNVIHKPLEYVLRDHDTAEGFSENLQTPSLPV